MTGEWALAALLAGVAGALVGSHLDVVRHRSQAGLPQGPEGGLVAAALGVLSVLVHLRRPGSGHSRLLTVQVPGYGLPVLGAATAVTALLELAAGHTTSYLIFTAATVVAAATAVPAARAAQTTAPTTSSPARPAPASR